MIKDKDLEKVIFEKTFNRDQVSLDDRVLHLGRIDKILQLHAEFTSRSSDQGTSHRLVN